MYNVIKPVDINDLRECIRIYMQYDTGKFISHNENAALINLQNYLCEGSELRIIKLNNKIIAWILFKKVYHDFSGLLSVIQQYCCCIGSARQRIDCIIALHNYMYEWAKYRKSRMCISACSHLDPKLVFAKVLRKIGWQSEGYLCKKMIE